jgi:hypothetical protein
MLVPGLALGVAAGVVVVAPPAESFGWAAVPDWPGAATVPPGVVFEVVLVVLVVDSLGAVPVSLPLGVQAAIRERALSALNIIAIFFIESSPCRLRRLGRRVAIGSCGCICRTAIAKRAPDGDCPLLCAAALEKRLPAG